MYVKPQDSIGLIGEEMSVRIVTTIIDANGIASPAWTAMSPFAAPAPALIAGAFQTSMTCCVDKVFAK